jgi:hypothetical protein
MERETMNIPYLRGLLVVLGLFLLGYTILQFTAYRRMHPAQACALLLEYF